MEIILDGACMLSVEETHRYLAHSLHFPPCYGGNLDALADCLSDLGEDTTLILTNEQVMKKQLGDYADRLLEVFREVACAPWAFRWQRQTEGCSDVMLSTAGEAAAANDDIKNNVGG